MIFPQEVTTRSSWHRGQSGYFWDHQCVISRVWSEGMERGVGEGWERQHKGRRKNEKEKVYRRVLKLISTERKREGCRSEERDQ